MNNDTNGNVNYGTNGIIDIDYQSAREQLRDLEMVSCDELTKKVNELSEIIDHIEQNWQGVNSEHYRKRIADIIEAISLFKKNSLMPIIADVNEQVMAYQHLEEKG